MKKTKSLHEYMRDFTEVSGVVLEQVALIAMLEDMKNNQNEIIDILQPQTKGYGKPKRRDLLIGQLSKEETRKSGV